jgi:hypothetical protein
VPSIVRVISGGWYFNATTRIPRIQDLFAATPDPRDVTVHFGASEGRLTAGSALHGLQGLLRDSSWDGIDGLLTFDTRAHRYIGTIPEHVAIVAVATSGGNATALPMNERLDGGLRLMDPNEFYLNQLLLLKTVAPEVDRLTFLTYAYDESTANRKAIELAAARHAITQYNNLLAADLISSPTPLQPSERAIIEIGDHDGASNISETTIDELDASFQTVFGLSVTHPSGSVARNDGLFVLRGAVMSYYRRSIIRNANAIGLRAVYPAAQFAAEGGLAAYGSDGDARVGRAIAILKPMLPPDRVPGKVFQNMDDVHGSYINSTTAGEQGALIPTRIPTWVPTPGASLDALGNINTGAPDQVWERDDRVNYLLNHSTGDDRNPQTDVDGTITRPDGGWLIL